MIKPNKNMMIQQAQQDTPVQPSIKQMAYGGSTNNTPIQGGSLYRIERGNPIIRSGRYVASTPLHKALPLNSPVQQTVQITKIGQFTNAVLAIQSTNTANSNSQVTGVNNTPVTIVYPTIIKS